MERVNTVLSGALLIWKLMYNGCKHQEYTGAVSLPKVSLFSVGNIRFLRDCDNVSIILIILKNSGV